RKARTDPEPLPSEMEGLADRAEATNLVSIYAALANRTSEDVLSEFGGKGFGDFKPALADLAVSVLEPITTEMNRLLADPAEIDRILGDGANRAAEIAEPVLAETYEKVGFLRSR
ncbi:MAG: tryptophan--tRNA ligase, partial [Pseudomonadota bacterium]